MILFFDTETTGLVDDRLPLDHEAQPYVVQLAALLCEDDGEPTMSVSLIVDPGVDIPPRASAVHGISTERAKLLGVASRAAIGAFNHMAARASLLVAHNVRFDLAVIEIARLRLGLPHAQHTTFCTMETATPIVNLPPTERMLAAGFNKPKAPKLEECIRHFFGEGLTGAHDAMVDVDACKRVFFHLKTLEKAA
jgi:DNA polymerase-3 subunit epsilon